MDHTFIERLLRSVKYEEIYIREHATLLKLERGLTRWFERYNTCTATRPGAIHSCETWVNFQQRCQENGSHHAAYRCKSSHQTPHAEWIAVVHPAGIEPASAVPETAVLSVELWVQIVSTRRAEDRGAICT